MRMTLQLIIIIILCSFATSIPWNTKYNCPSACTCREEHFVDLAIARYTQYSNHDIQVSSDYQFTNNVLYHDMNLNEENPLLKVATCFIQAETDIEKFIPTMPKSIQALSLIKSSDSGNKSLKTSHLNYFDELVAFEAQGSDPVTNESGKDDFIVEIDHAVPSLKYLNLIQTQIKNRRIHDFKEQTEDVEIKYESVTMIQKKKTESEILPYYKYKEIQRSLENPVFCEFSNLILVRIYGCNLQNIHWEMFDGLQNLKHLYLENNYLKFIPNFAFYGTPNLRTLSLAWNHLLNIQITDLAGLLELEYLDLSHNNFSQLSELSFPPFPKLKVADFRDNPISSIFPNTFDIMNTTDSIIIGSEQIQLELLPNSFLGLNQLIKLTIYNVDVAILVQGMLTGMPILKEFILTGNVNRIQFDAFIEISNVETLILSNCSIYNISMDAFYGLDQLLVLDLSNNRLKYLPPHIFDGQKQLKELILNGNELTELPKGIFNNIPAKLIRLNHNPWHCSCAMSDWNPMVINKVKQITYTPCDSQYDKGISCNHDKRFTYSYENRMAPKCNTPKVFQNFNVFQTVKRHLQCQKLETKNTTENLMPKTDYIEKKLYKINKNKKNNGQTDHIRNYESNHLLGNYPLENINRDFAFYFHEQTYKRKGKEEEMRTKLMKKKKHMYKKLKKYHIDKEM